MLDRASRGSKVEWRPQNSFVTTPVNRFLRSQYVWPALLLAVGVGMALNEWLYQRATSVSGQLAALVESRATINRVLVNLGDLDMALRACLRVGAADSCRSIGDARNAVARDVDSLEAIATGSTANVARAAEFARAVAARVEHVDHTVAVYAREGSAAASARLDAPDAPRRSSETEIPVGRDVVASIDRLVHASDDRVRRGMSTYRFGIAALIVLFATGVMIYRRQVSAYFALREEKMRELAREHDRLGDLVAERTRDLHELTRHLQTAREDERRNLARELHDEMGALLTAAKMDLARMRSKVPLNDEGKQRLLHLSTMLDQGIELKRRIIEDLRPSSLDGLGLLPALQSLCVGARERLGVTFDLSLDPAVKLGPEASLAVYRLVQEALTNIAKYASAKRVTVRAWVDGERAHIEVVDDGRGFDMSKVGIGHHGLSGMRFRIESLGGSMTVDSRPGQGTAIRASLPNGVPPEPAADDAVPATPDHVGAAPAHLHRPVTDAASSTLPTAVNPGT